MGIVMLIGICLGALFSICLGAAILCWLLGECSMLEEDEESLDHG